MRNLKAFQTAALAGCLRRSFPRAAELNNYDAKDPTKCGLSLMPPQRIARKPAAAIEWQSPRPSVELSSAGFFAPRRVGPPRYPSNRSSIFLSRRFCARSRSASNLLRRLLSRPKRQLVVGDWMSAVPGWALRSSYSTQACARLFGRSALGPLLRSAGWCQSTLRCGWLSSLHDCFGRIIGLMNASMFSTSVPLINGIAGRPVAGPLVLKDRAEKTNRDAQSRSFKLGRQCLCRVTARGAVPRKGQIVVAQWKSDPWRSNTATAPTSPPAAEESTFGAKLAAASIAQAIQAAAFEGRHATDDHDVVARSMTSCIEFKPRRHLGEYRNSRSAPSPS